MTKPSLICSSISGRIPARRIPTCRTGRLARSGLLGSFTRSKGTGSILTTSDSSSDARSSQGISWSSDDVDGEVVPEPERDDPSSGNAEEHHCSATFDPRLPKTDVGINEVDVKGPRPPGNHNDKSNSTSAYCTSVWKPANIATNEAKKYTKESPSLSFVSMVDSVRWDGIRQLSKADLLVGKFLGKGSFSDVFEVMVSVAKDYELMTLESLDGSRKESDVKLIDSKFHGTSSPDIVDGFKERLGSKEVCHVQKNGDKENDLDKEIDAKYSSAGHVFKEATPKEGTEHGKHCSARRPSDDQQQVIMSPNGAHSRRHNLGLSRSFCPGIQSGGPSKKQSRKVTLAMKCLRPQVRSNAEKFSVGIEDIIQETVILAGLDHPNIIKIHGRAADRVSGSPGPDEGYFILLDRLTDTLEDRIGRWKKTADKRAPPFPSQIKTALCIADAMSYLHSRNIVFRDLKPANVGFDSMGVLKIFDFGFAIAADGPGDAPSGNTALLYEVCGTPRYMAPEVGLAPGYGAPVDVYSFGILLWEMCALRRPFDGFRSGAELRRAISRGSRPKLIKSWPTNLRELMSGCWSSAPSDRPKMEVAKSMLAANVRELLAQRDGGGVGSRRKLSFRRFTD